MSERVYISHAELSGYKTVSDVKVDFVPGLNIIIGKNGTGKTNFLTFLNRALIRDYTGLQNFETSLLLNSGQDTCRVIAKKRQSLIDSKREDITDIIVNDPPEIQILFKNKDGEFKKISDDRVDIAKELRERGFTPIPLMISHGLKSPNENKVIDSPYSFSIQLNNTASSSLLSEFVNADNTFFFKSLSGTLLFYLVEQLRMDYDNEKELGKLYEFNEKEIRRLIDEVFTLVTDVFNNAIHEYLPIGEVRLSEAYNVYNDENQSSIKVENIYMEFLIDGTWLPFSSLSDGTKRIFSIYADLVSPQYFDFPSTLNKIILLEEPELGIHPHQLHLLMTFIKSLSKQHQIIVTTHSPLVIDILGIDEFDSLLISNITKENGTQLMKLNDDQLSAAKFYMENESYLSDYWRYSDLNL